MSAFQNKPRLKTKATGQGNHWFWAGSCIGCIYNTSLCASLGKTWLGQPHWVTCVVIPSNLAQSWSQWCCHGRNHAQNRLCSGVRFRQAERSSVWFTLIRLRLYNQHWLLPFTSQLSTACILIAISSLVKWKQLWSILCKGCHAVLFVCARAPVSHCRLLVILI